MSEHILMEQIYQMSSAYKKQTKKQASLYPVFHFIKYFWNCKAFNLTSSISYRHFRGKLKFSTLNINK